MPFEAHFREDQTGWLYKTDRCIDRWNLINTKSADTLHLYSHNLIWIFTFYWLMPLELIHVCRMVNFHKHHGMSLRMYLLYVLHTCTCKINPISVLIAPFSDTQIFSTKYPVTCKVFTGYHTSSELEHGSAACTVDSPLAQVRGLSLRTCGQAMLYLSPVFRLPYSQYI